VVAVSSGAMAGPAMASEAPTKPAGEHFEPRATKQLRQPKNVFLALPGASHHHGAARRRRSTRPDRE
jgi:hypothetical protein